MSMLIDNKFNIGEVVYVKTDTEQLPRYVFCIQIYQGDIVYEVKAGTQVSAHYDYELSLEKDVLKTL